MNSMSLNILFLSHLFYPNVGGIETNAEVLADEFVEAGHHVRMLTWSIGQSDRKFKYKVIRGPSMIQLIREHAWADVVFENNPCLRLAWPKLFFGSASVVALNTWVAKVDGTIGIQERIKFWWLKNAQSVIAVSNAVRRHSWPLATVVGNPYQASVFQTITHSDRTKYFVFLGRLVSTKGAELAINAVHILVSRSTNDLLKSSKHLLTIIGDGPEKYKLQQLALSLGLQEVVHFTGVLQGAELAMSLNSHRFMIIPSLWEEPFGNVALEGMACGCVPIASNGGGLPDAVGNGGLLFERGNVNALVENMQLIINDSKLEKQLRSEGVAHIERHHPAEVAAQYLKAIESSVK